MIPRREGVRHILLVAFAVAAVLRPAVYDIANDAVHRLLLYHRDVVCISFLYFSVVMISNCAYK